MLLLDRLPFRRQAPPAPAPESRPTLNRLINDAVIRLPYVPQLRIFWRDLQAEREWWPVLLPLLAWIGWRTYQSERQKLRTAAGTLPATKK